MQKLIKPELLRKESTVRFAHLILSHTGGNPNREEERDSPPNGLLKKKRSACPTNKSNLPSRLALEAEGYSNQPKWELGKR